MAGSVFGSGLYGPLFPVGESGRLFSDSAEVRAMLVVEGALAQVQGQLGVIPEVSAKAIHRASLEITLDPAALGPATGQNGVPVPGLIAAFREAMNAPEHAQFVHWGATSQDIVDTALMLRLRQALVLVESRLGDVLRWMADQAEAHADTPMAARTYGQQATPTSWGSVLAQWGAPLCDSRDGLANVRETSLWVSLSGAAGTASALPRAREIRGGLAQALKLGDPERSWHTDRGPILRIAGWMADLTAAIASMGHGLTALATTEVGEVAISGAGASSTMPQKANPVGPSALVALNTHMSGLRAALQQAAMHQHQRDGAAWFAEWMVVPQVALTCAAAVEIAAEMQVSPQPKAMSENLAASRGLIHAEALSFALAARMPRPDAQAETKRLCAEARAKGRSLADVAGAAHDNLPADLFDAERQMGDAPTAARAFVQRVRTS